MKEGRGQGEGGRAKGGKGWKSEKMAGNLKQVSRMRVWCDPQLGDEGKV